MKPKPFNRDLAERLRELRDESPNWPTYADFCMQLIHAWRANLTKFHLKDDSIEDIAKDRIKWTCMIQGIELMFFQMDQIIKELNKREKEDDDGRNEREHRKTG
jgi:hypothetical protein